jgi:hypothetical protein
LSAAGSGLLILALSSFSVSANDKMQENAEEKM